MLAVLGVVVLGAKADAQITNLNARTAQLETITPVVSDRLARLEEQTKTNTRMLERIEGKVDELVEDKPTRSR